MDNSINNNIDNKDKYYSDLILKGLYKKKLNNFKNKKYSYVDIEFFLKKVNCEDIEITKDLIDNLSYKLFDLNTFFNLVKNECDKVGNLDNFKIPESFKNINQDKDKDQYKLKLLSNKLQNNKDKLNRINSLLKNGEDLYIQQGGLPTDGYITDPRDGSFTKLLDIVQLILDIVGFFPVIGDAVDIINGVLSLLRGQFIDALLSFLAAIPVIGSVISVPLKIFKKINKLNKVRKVMKARKIAKMARRGQKFKGYYDDVRDNYDDVRDNYD